MINYSNQSKKDKLIHPVTVGAAAGPDTLLLGCTSGDLCLMQCPKGTAGNFSLQGALRAAQGCTCASRQADRRLQCAAAATRGMLYRRSIVLRVGCSCATLHAWQSAAEHRPRQLVPCRHLPAARLSGQHRVPARQPRRQHDCRVHHAGWGHIRGPCRPQGALTHTKCLYCLLAAMRPAQAGSFSAVLTCAARSGQVLVSMSLSLPVRSSFCVTQAGSDERACRPRRCRSSCCRQRTGAL